MGRAAATAGYGPVRIYKDPRSNVWFARFTNRGRREHFSLKVTRRDVAEKKARELADLIETGQYSKLINRRAARDRLFADVMADFLEKGSQWAESTRHSCRSSVNRLTAEFGDLPIEYVDAASIEAYLVRRRDEGRTKSTRNRELAILKAVLKKAHEWGYVPYNAAADVKTEREGKKQPQPYTREEIDRMFAELQPQHRQIATIYLHTGLRRGELMKLMWSDVDFEAGTITVRKAKNEDDRTVPLSAEVFQILQEHRQERRARVVDLRVFGETADIRKVLDRAAVRAGFEEGRRHRLQHRLRDSCATMLLDAGRQLDEVQEILGHRDIGMTRRYAQTRPERLREAIKSTFG